MVGSSGTLHAARKARKRLGGQGSWYDDEDVLDTVVVLTLLACMLLYLGRTCWSYLRYKRSLRTTVSSFERPLEDKDGEKTN